VPAASFGSRSAAPVEALSPLRPATAAKIFVSGGLCASAAHVLLVPLDVVKTQLQAEAGRYDGPLDCARSLIDEGGASAFAKGLSATAVGYAVAGCFSFGLLELLSRQVSAAVGAGNALFFSTPLLAVSSVFATAVCAVALCPFEAVRIVAVRSGSPSLEVCKRMLATDGVRGLYRGLGPILLKEVPYTVTKFVVFDSVLPQVQELLGALGPADSLAAIGVPIVAGAAAGTCAVLASQPADVLLTLTNEEGATLSTSVPRLTANPALTLNGLGPRLLFGVLLTSLQFLFYTQLRGLFGVSKGDLTLVLDALATINGGAG